MIPYGVGNSLEGHVLVLQGGVLIDLSQLNRITAVNADDLDITLERADGSGRMIHMLIGLRVASRRAYL